MIQLPQINDAFIGVIGTKDAGPVGARRLLFTHVT